MSAVAADLLAYIDTNTSETAGTDLFEGGFTEQPDNQVCVIHFGGGDAERVMSASKTAPDIETALVQVLVRNTAMATANTKAQAIHALLDNLQEYSGTSGTRYMLIESMAGEPHSVGVDDNHRWVYMGNYEVQKARG